MADGAAIADEDNKGTGIKAIFQRCVRAVPSLLRLRGSSEPPQFLILGLSGAGKTTLLYRLKIGQSWENMQGDMEEMRKPDKEGKVLDPGYHYEEMSRDFNHGMWDIPGTEGMRHMWSCFYHSIKIHGVIFVVGVTDEDQKVIDLAKKNLHFLMNEDELRFAAFAVVINQRADKETGKEHYSEDDLQYRLGLHNLHKSCAWRTKHFIVNCDKLNGESDKEWAKVRTFLKQTLMDPNGHNMTFR